MEDIVLSPVIAQIEPGIGVLPLIVSCIILIILLGLSAMVSGSEVAFFSLGPAEIDELNKKEGKKSEIILDLLEKPKDLLAIILIANNFVNVGIIILASYISSGLFPPETVGVLTKFIIDVVVITFILLLFGEVIPKVYATKHGTQVSLLMARPLYVLGKTFPLNYLKVALVKGTAVISNLGKKKSVNVSSDELQHALELTISEDDDVDQEDHKILKGIVRFGNKDVKQIMQSRMDVEAVEINKPFSELFDFLVESKFSRIPVYRDSFDKIEGILVVKDLLPHIDQSDDFEWKSLIRDPYFVPENKKIDDLLTSFQEMKTHMAIVVDEYGGSSGIVTLEDVLEEIVGDISDEFDEDDISYSKLDEFNYVFEGKTPLIDVYRILDIDGKEFEDAKSESDTLAGFIIEQAGKILRKNERLTFKNYEFKVEAADIRKVKRIKMTILRDEKNVDENE